jgi:hypothetical protein
MHHMIVAKILVLWLMLDVAILLAVSGGLDERFERANDRN